MAGTAVAHGVDDVAVHAGPPYCLTCSSFGALNPLMSVVKAFHSGLTGSMRNEDATARVVLDS